MNIQLFGGKGDSYGGGSGGGNKLMDGSSKSTIDKIVNLKKGSEIEVSYSDGKYTDTFRLQNKKYSMVGDVTAWVNVTSNGWKNDFMPNRTTVESELRRARVRIIKRG